MEHVALQVADPVAFADWYVKNLGFAVKRAGGEPAFARFLLEQGGAIMLEIYRNPRLPVPDYATADPLMLHLAFVSDNPAQDRDRLVQAGARLLEDVAANPAGDQFVMLRDPWGIPIQLAKRAEPMLPQWVEHDLERA